MVNRYEALILYKDGTSFSDIGKQFGVSRQRIWQILKPIVKNNLANRKYFAKDIFRMPSPTESEKYIAKILSNSGFEVEHMPYNHPFDLKVNGKRVEVKHRNKASFRSGNAQYYSFNNLISLEKVDFYIFICGELEKGNFFVIPSSKIKSLYLKIPAVPSFKKTKRFYEEYYRNTKLLKRS